LLLGLDATYSLDPEPTGVAVYSREILRGLASEGRPGPVYAYYRPHRIVRALRSPSAPGIHRRVLLDSAAPGVDVFHGLNQRLPPKKKGKFVVTFHDLFVMTDNYSTPEFRERFARLAREAAQRADAIIAVSEFTAGQVRSLLSVSNRIHVIRHGIHPASLSPRREKAILHVGAIQRRKNLVRLIEAFEALPSGWKLVLAGGSGYGVEEVRARVERSPRRADIEIPGYVTPAELEALYARASIFAFPSLGEGFGIPVLEAMVRGIPVVTSDRTATAEVAGDAALKVNPLDSSAIAGALERIIESEELQTKLRDAGIAQAAGFSWSEAVSRTRAVYEGLV
jgi:glycosyltransferase involved in cell wall biosynthesis